MLEARRCWQEAEREVSAAGLALQSGLEKFALDKKDLDNAMKDIERKQRALDAECLEMSCINEIGMRLDKNPLFVWGEILLADPAKPLPKWVHEYLQKVASELMVLAGDNSMSGEKPLNRLKAILGFSRRRWNAFTDLRRFEQAASATMDLIPRLAVKALFLRSPSDTGSPRTPSTAGGGCVSGVFRRSLPSAT